MEQTANKESAVSFLKLVTSGDIHKAYQTYVAENFRHHNPYFAGDTKSLMEGMEENHQRFPNKKFTVQRVLEDGDLVAVHGEVLLDAATRVAVVHIFRFENGLIAELWDIGQAVPENSPNINGMF